MTAQRIVPGQFAGRHAADPPARLAGTLVSVAAAGLIEPGRLRRGRRYMLDGAVLELTLDFRRLGGLVAGSDVSPYRVEVAVDEVERPADLTGVPQRHHFAHLAPQTRELLTSCSCPDGDLVCKHIAAVLLAFADEVSYQPELLVVWRCAQPGEPGARVHAGSRARFGTYVPPARAAAAAPVSPFASDEWQQFLAAPSTSQVATGTATSHSLGREPFGPIDLAQWVLNARAAIVSLAASRRHGSG